MLKVICTLTRFFPSLFKLAFELTKDGCLNLNFRVYLSGSAVNTFGYVASASKTKELACYSLNTVPLCLKHLQARPVDEPWGKH